MGQAMQHVPPIFAFGLGVAAAKLLGTKPTKRTFRSTLTCMAIELAIFGVLVAIGTRLPGEAVISIVAFVAALQSTSFSTIGAWTFNSVMTTANLKSLTIALVDAIRGAERRDRLAQSRTLGSIICCFAGGALLGRRVHACISGVSARRMSRARGARHGPHRSSASRASRVAASERAEINVTRSALVSSCSIIG